MTLEFCYSDIYQVNSLNSFSRGHYFLKRENRVFAFLVKA